MFSSRNIINAKNYSKYWDKDFCDELEKYLDKSVYSATFGLGPSLSAQIPLNTSSESGIATSVFIYISLIANFFSVEIIQVDNNLRLKQLSQNTLRSELSNVIVSPYSRYREIFLKIENSIRKKFKDYKFFPAKFDHIYLKGLSVIQGDLNDGSLSDAFFKKKSERDDVKYTGDIHYGDIIY